MTALRCCTLLTEVADKPCEVLPFRTLLKPPFTFLFFPIEEYIFFLHGESAKKTFSHLLRLFPQPPIKSSFGNLCNVLILMFKIGGHLKFRCFFVHYMDKVVVAVKYSNLTKAHSCGIAMDMQMKKCVR